VRQTTLATLDSASLTVAFNLAYTDYVVPLSMTEAQLAQHIGNNDVDLEHSPLWLAPDDSVVGLAALGVRGARGWIGGFGVAPEHRGQGLSHQFTAGVLAVARDLGLRTAQLEVITTNSRAIRAYQQAGFQITRDLRILHRPADAPPPAAPRNANVVAADARGVLQPNVAGRPVAPPWQREPVALARGASPRALALHDASAPRAWLVYSTGEQSVSIGELVAHDADDARTLLEALAHDYPGRSISLLNAPTDDPAEPAFDMVSFREVLRQHEMLVELV
jgi:ribosomal protein S18 acetylase RimI-like enzyme